MSTPFSIPSSRSTGSSLEPLESRIAPAASVLSIGGVTSASFVDGDGDTITLRISGTSGTLTLADTNGDGTVDDGEAIGSMTITGASANFLVTAFLVTAPGSNGLGYLGKLTSDKAFLGLNTMGSIGTTMGSSPFNGFDLSSFKAPGLSANGVISVGRVLGDTDGNGLLLSGGLLASANINIAGSFDGKLNIGGKLAGSIQIGADVASGAWTITNLAPTGSISVGAVIDAPVTFLTPVAGTMKAVGNANGAWNLPALASTGSLSAASWPNLTVAGVLDGELESTSGFSSLTIGTIGGKANILSRSSMSMTVEGSVMAGSQIICNSSINATVNGTAVAGFISSKSDIGLVASSAVLSGTLNASYQLIVEAKSASGLNLESQDEVTMTLAGGIAKSRIFSGDSNMSITAGGSITDSSLETGAGIIVTATGDLKNSTLDGSESSVSLNLTGSVLNSRITSGSEDISLQIGGNVVKSSLSTPEGDVSGTVGGSVVGSRFDSHGTSVAVTGGITDSYADAYGSITFSAGTTVSKLRASASGDVTLISKGLSLSNLSAGDDLSISINGGIVGSFLTGTGKSDDSQDSSVVVTGAIVGTQISSNKGLGVSATDVINSRFSGLSSPTSGSALTSGLGWGLSANVTGKVVNSEFLAPNDDLYLNVDGTITNATVHAASTVSMTVGGDVLNSHIFADEDGENVYLSVGGKLANSFVVSGSENVSVSVGGDVVSSQLSAGESGVTLNVGGNVLSSKLTGYEGVSATVTGGVTGSSVVSTDGDVSLTVGTSLVSSTVTAKSNLNLAVTNDATSVRLSTGSYSNVTIGGSLLGTLKQTSGDSILSVTGGVKAGSLIYSVGTLRATVGQLDGSISTGKLDLVVNGGVGKASKIRAASVEDLNSDNTSFSVTNDFSGRLDVVTSFDTGTGSTATLVGGKVTAGAVLNLGTSVGGTGSADKFVFAGDMLGSISINDNLNTTLDFKGAVSRLAIRGQVFKDISVVGKIAAISVGSVYAATDSTSGVFKDANDTQTAALTAGLGIGTIVSI